MQTQRPVWKFIEQHFSLLRKSQRTTIAALVAGLLRSGKIGIAAIARGMRPTTCVRYRIKRVERFAANWDVDPHKITLGLAEALLAPKGNVILVDWTHVLDDYMLLCAHLAMRGRSVPIAWACVRQGAFKKSRNAVEEGLILRLKEAIGDRGWVLVADRGFARASLLAKLPKWGIDYVIRACGSVWISRRGFDDKLENTAAWPGMRKIFKAVAYHQRLQVPVNLVVVHREPAPQPWYLITNLAQPGVVERIYRKRMWIEESFRDAKRTLGLDKMWLCEPARYENMMIILALAILLAILTAMQHTTHRADLKLATKRKGVVLSVFMIGFTLIRYEHYPPATSLRPLSLALS
jgi:hypothetical protein